MKITRTIAMASALLLAAGCAHEEQHAQYDESISPYASDGTPRYNSYGGSYSPGGAATGASPSQSASRSDNTIVTQVRESLQQDPEIAPIVPSIQISANNGTIVLNGIVQSEEQKRQIGSIVHNTGGVVTVNNQLQVAPTGQGGAGQAAPNAIQGAQEGGATGQSQSSSPQLSPNTAPSGQSSEGGTLNPTSTSNNSPPQIYQSSSNSVSAPSDETLNPTSSSNSAPRLYQEPGNGMENSSSNALPPTSRTNGASEIYQEKNNQGKSMEQQNPQQTPQ